MPELYKVLDPKDVPNIQAKRKGKGHLRLAIEAMKVGDVIAIPAREANSVHTVGAVARMRLSRVTDGDVCYVRRLPDDAS